MKKLFLAVLVVGMSLAHAEQYGYNEYDSQELDESMKRFDEPLDKLEKMVDMLERANRAMEAKKAYEA